MNVAIPPDLIGLVQAQVAGGHFSSELEMIAQGLRLLKLQSERFADLRREIGIGIGALALPSRFRYPFIRCIIWVVEDLPNRF
jgi:Arc/MetJ-type ribon-helix-helix transcriptional regulator